MFRSRSLGAIQATASTKTVDIDAAGNIALAAVTSDAALTIDATNSGTVTCNGNLESEAGSVAITAAGAVTTKGTVRAVASSQTITIQAGGASTIGDSAETDDVTAHGNVSITTTQTQVLGTSGALTTNGDISSTAGNVVLDSAAGLDTNQPISATSSSATVTINDSYKLQCHYKE